MASVLYSILCLIFILLNNVQLNSRSMPQNWNSHTVPTHCPWTLSNGQPCLIPLELKTVVSPLNGNQGRRFVVCTGHHDNPHPKLWEFVDLVAEAPGMPMFSPSTLPVFSPSPPPLSTQPAPSSQPTQALPHMDARRCCAQGSCRKTPNSRCPRQRCASHCILAGGCSQPGHRVDGASLSQPPPAPPPPQLHEPPYQLDPPPPSQPDLRTPTASQPAATPIAQAAVSVVVNAPRSATASANPYTQQLRDAFTAQQAVEQSLRERNRAAVAERRDSEAHSKNEVTIVAFWADDEPAVEASHQSSIALPLFNITQDRLATVDVIHSADTKAEVYSYQRGSFSRMVTLPFTVTLPAGVHTVIVRAHGVRSCPGLDGVVQKALSPSDVPNVRSGLQVQRQVMSKKLKDAEVKVINNRTKSYDLSFTPLPPMQGRPRIPTPPPLLSDSDDELDGDLTVMWSSNPIFTGRKPTTSNRASRPAPTISKIDVDLTLSDSASPSPPRKRSRNGKAREGTSSTYQPTVPSYASSSRSTGSPSRASSSRLSTGPPSHASSSRLSTGPPSHASSSRVSVGPPSRASSSRQPAASSSGLSMALSSHVAAVSPSSRVREWPKEYFCCDVDFIFSQVYDASCTDRSTTFFEVAGLPMPPASTLNEQHKRWMSAPVDLRQQYIEYGSTAKGLWSQFAKVWRRPDQDWRNAKAKTRRGTRKDDMKARSLYPSTLDDEGIPSSDSDLHNGRDYDSHLDYDSSNADQGSNTGRDSTPY